ncbi:MAG: hypothetical protein Hyperionvirus1_31 [Hyperionvirus sp.]|uniref:Uncharacterized protein n=1 Tax=Hyperionvirus sp. TaxID=2487770 RepID=A0A3G5A603_9VIRU|nr:MAG: hypothetical protein Hyperionvirus1_31 [Hyperionvirus sp.]
MWRSDLGVRMGIPAGQVPVDLRVRQEAIAHQGAMLREHERERERVRRGAILREEAILRQHELARQEIAQRDRIEAARAIAAVAELERERKRVGATTGETVRAIAAVAEVERQREHKLVRESVMMAERADAARAVAAVADFERERKRMEAVRAEAARAAVAELERADAARAITAVADFERAQLERAHQPALQAAALREYQRLAAERRAGGDHGRGPVYVVVAVPVPVRQT